MTPAEKSHALRKAIPPGGLFAGKEWRLAPDPFPLPSELHARIVDLGPRLHAFYQACNLLYRQSVEGKQPAWIHRYLDAGKPEAVVQMAREKAWKNDLPAVIRPDILLTDEGLVITELDSVPGGIGLTAWLQEAYAAAGASRLTPHASRVTSHESRTETVSMTTILEGFRTILAPPNIELPSNNPRISAIVISEESRDYRPEMEWIAERIAKLETQNAESSAANLPPSAGFQLRASSFVLPTLCRVCSPADLEYRPEGVFLNGERVDVIYRFFELFDLPNLANMGQMLDAARAGRVRVTPPFKPQLEEKLWFALFWFPQLAGFWRRELGDRYARDLREVIPFTWLLDPAPLPPHAVIPQLGIHDWNQLGSFSQKQRDLVLKISGFSDRAWGSRGVYVGSDLSQEEWRQAVSRSLAEFDRHPHILQRFEKTCLVEHAWWDFERGELVPMKGRLRLCPYYFVTDNRPSLGGVLATLCPADKKIIHGMRDAIMTLVVPAAEIPVQ